MRETYEYYSKNPEHSILNHYAKKFEHLGIDSKGKAILNIRADLWFPIEEEITANISYYLKEKNDPVTVEKTFVDTPYPNKCISSISKRFGRKKAVKGIPLIFDSVDELLKIEKIEIIWTIEATNEVVIIDYPVKFEKPVQDRIYTLWTYDQVFIGAGKKKSDLKLVNGKVESEFNRSEYDDFYFLALHDDSLAVIEELHKEGSHFNIDFANFKMLPPKMKNAMLFNTLRQVHEGDNSCESYKCVYYYHADILLNDYTA